MRVALALAVIGIIALILRGVLSTVLPSALRPDLALVLIIGLGLQRPGAIGLLLAALLGCLADILTGAFLGQHALLFVVAFAVTRLAGFQLDLRRSLPTSFLVMTVSVVHGLGSVALPRLFGGAVAWPSPGRLVGQGLLDALVAVALLPLLAAVVHALTEDDRRTVPLAPRRREA